jgi:hypothetical protein
MDANRTARPSGDDGPGLAAVLVGLGALTMALFPFLIPALAVAALIAFPLVVPLFVGAVVVGAIAVPTWLVLRAVRALRRRRSRRERIATARRQHGASAQSTAQAAR